MKKIVAFISTLILLISLIPLPVSAASTRKCYLIENRNTPAYGNSSLTRQIGTIWGSDEIQVITVTSRYCYVSYPAGKRRKYAYIPTNKILTGTGGNTYSAQQKIVTYKRPGGSTYGSIYKGDRVTILGTYGNYTQIKYPIYAGYKYAFVTTENAIRYIKGTSNNFSTIATGSYKITTALNPNYALDVNNFATFNGGNVEIYPFHNTNNEIWQISSFGNGYYRIKDTNSGKSLDVNGASSASGTNVQIWENNNTNAQKWRFVSAGNGYYYIINANGCYLDVRDGIVRNGNNVWVFTGNGSAAQKWKLTPLSEGNSPSTPSGKGFVINGIDIGYAAGSYFTDNGRACTDHGIKGKHSFFNESACNCICTYNGRSLGAVQCFGFARYVQSKIYGENSYTNPRGFYKMSGAYVPAGKLTTTKLKSLIQSTKPGTHLRTNGNQHSMIITNITDSGFSIIQCNGSNNREYSGYCACRIGTYTYTWSSYVNSTYGKRGINFIEIKR